MFTLKMHKLLNNLNWECSINSREVSAYFVAKNNLHAHLLSAYAAKQKLSLAL